MEASDTVRRTPSTRRLPMPSAQVWRLPAAMPGPPPLSCAWQPCGMQGLGAVAKLPHFCRSAIQAMRLMVFFLVYERLIAHFYNDATFMDGRRKIRRVIFHFFDLPGESSERHLPCPKRLERKKDRPCGVGAISATVRVPSASSQTFTATAVELRAWTWKLSF
jgi:hypothetical protein